MKRRLGYLVAAFWAFAALGWVSDAVVMFHSSATDTPVTPDRWDAIVYGMGASVIAYQLARWSVQAWRNARPSDRVVGTVVVRFNVDTSKFELQMREAKHAVAKFAKPTTTKGTR